MIYNDLPGAGLLGGFRSEGITNCSLPLLVLVEVEVGGIWVEVKEARSLFFAVLGVYFGQFQGGGHSFCQFMNSSSVQCQILSRSLRDDA